jgi:hypothetical protein
LAFLPPFFDVKPQLQYLGEFPKNIRRDVRSDEGAVHHDHYDPAVRGAIHH